MYEAVCSNVQCVALWTCFLSDVRAERGRWNELERLRRASIVGGYVAGCGRETAEGQLLEGACCMPANKLSLIPSSFLRPTHLLSTRLGPSYTMRSVALSALLAVAVSVSAAEDIPKPSFKVCQYPAFLCIV